MAVLLDESGRARSYYLQLNAMDFATDLAKQMLEHAQVLEKIYGEIQGKVAREKNDVEDYADLVFKVNGLQKWFDKAEAGDDRGRSSNP